MGACSFFDIATGDSARTAFSETVEQALWEHGHGGYSGTIAEKHSFVEIRLPNEVASQVEAELDLRKKGRLVEDYARRLLRDGDSRVDDKWGPAGCIHFAERHYLFFGLASS